MRKNYYIRKYHLINASEKKVEKDGNRRNREKRKNKKKRKEKKKDKIREKDLVKMDVGICNRRVKMLDLREKLFVVEQNRTSDKKGCSLDELDEYLEDCLC